MAPRREHADEDVHQLLGGNVALQVSPSAKQSLVVGAQPSVWLPLLPRNRVGRPFKHTYDKARGKAQAVRAKKVVKVVSQ